MCIRGQPPQNQRNVLNSSNITYSTLTTVKHVQCFFVASISNTLQQTSKTNTNLSIFFAETECRTTAAHTNAYVVHTCYAARQCVQNVYLIAHDPYPSSTGPGVTNDKSEEVILHRSRNHHTSVLPGKTSSTSHIINIGVWDQYVRSLQETYASNLCSSNVFSRDLMFLSCNINDRRKGFR